MPKKTTKQEHQAKSTVKRSRKNSPPRTNRSNEKTLVVIPAYNEESTVQEVVERSLKYADVCVVDDASKDKTPEILSRLKKKYGKHLHVVRHKKNTHIPGGIQDGMRVAVRAGYDRVITMDAGLSHDPDELPLFLSYPDCDLLIGARKKPEGVPLYRRMISFLGARAMNYSMSRGIFDLLGPNISDCTSGYRRYSRQVFSEIAKRELRSVAFDFHMEALHIAHSMGGTIRELEIRYRFSNSSFNRRVLAQAIRFSGNLIRQKWTAP